MCSQILTTIRSYVVTQVVLPDYAETPEGSLTVVGEEAFRRNVVKRGS
jgi:hypothetical protein